MGPSTLAPAGSLGLGEAHLLPIVLKPLFTSISFKGLKLFFISIFWEYLCKVSCDWPAAVRSCSLIGQSFKPFIRLVVTKLLTDTGGYFIRYLISTLYGLQPAPQHQLGGADQHQVR